MPVPTSVLEILHTQNVAYDIAETEKPKNLFGLPSEQSKTIVTSLVLQDSSGKVQVIFPRNNIIDLDALFRQFGRQLNGIPSSEIWQMINDKQLTTVPAIPCWNGMMTLVDESLLKMDMLQLESGNDGQVLQINQASFREMVTSCTLGAFSRPAPRLDTDAHEDESKIVTAIQRFTQRRIRQRLDETLELPPLPETAQRIIQLRANPDSDINDLANAIELDASLSAQVVSWAASPYYSAPGKIKSVHDAIVRVLGFDMVMNLSLGLALGKTLSPEVMTKPQLDQYWRDSVYSAAAVEGLVTSIPRETRPAFGMAYLSGLLNNFGTMIMAEVFPPYYANISRLSLANPHLPLATIEMSILGVTGNQIASWLLDNWNMPQEVVIALRQQYNPEFNGEHKAYPKLIYIANQMLANRGYGRGIQTEIPATLFEDLHLDIETAEKTINNIVESGDDLNSIADKLQG